MPLGRGSPTGRAGSVAVPVPEPVVSPRRRRRLLRTLLVLALVTLLVGYCAGRAGEPDGDAGGGQTAGEAAPEADEPPEDPPPPPCEASPDTAQELPAAEGTWSASEAVAASFDCAEVALVVPADQPALAAVAAPLAVASRAPLLLEPSATGDLEAALAELDDPEVRSLADEVPDEGGAADLALDVADELGTSRFVAAAVDQPRDLAAAASLALRTDAAVLPVSPDAPPTLPADAEVTTVGDLTAVLPEARREHAPWEVEAGASTALVVDPATPDAPAVVVLAALRGDTVVPASRGDLLSRGTLERVREAELARDQLVPVGELARVADLDRELTLLAEGPLLPGGTLRHFDGTRMVALYGQPGTPVLGVLGEQDLDASVERAREVATGYDADGREVVPAFEVIVTVASREAGDDGNYSRVSPPETVRELVDRAGEEGFQVILDLQPGRNDFLDQARIYEELLLEPHVGLALDPEWRLEPDQVHLQQIGGVDAAEVQRVVDWYAELTRDAGLPQQLLVLHQFRLSMLRDRDTVRVPPELAVVVHADGQGPQGQKLETWRVLTAGAEDRWHWGWKNFYDEDPVVAEPSYILELEPEVVLVTYQ